jgi:hypothetical protein
MDETKQPAKQPPKNPEEQPRQSARNTQPPGGAKPKPSETVLGAHGVRTNMEAVRQRANEIMDAGEGVSGGQMSNHVGSENASEFPGVRQHKTPDR